MLLLLQPDYLVWNKHCLFMSDRVFPADLAYVKRLELQFWRCSYWLRDPRQVNLGTQRRSDFYFAINSLLLQSSRCQREIPSATAMQSSKHRELFFLISRKIHQIVEFKKKKKKKSLSTPKTFIFSIGNSISVITFPVWFEQ